jgi:hypothetical protein
MVIWLFIDEICARGPPVQYERDTGLLTYIKNSQSCAFIQTTSLNKKMLFKAIFYKTNLF